MKIKYFENGFLQKEEVLKDGWIARISFKDSDIVNIDLSDFAEAEKKLIEIEPNSFLKITINDAPFFKSIYDIMGLYQGMKIVEFQSGEIKILIEW